MKNLDDFPEYKAAREKLLSLEAEQRVVDQEVQKLRYQPREHHLQRVEDKAQALLEGKDPFNGSGPMARERDLADALARAEERSRVLRHAMGIKRRELRDLRYRFGREICKTLIPEHKRIVKNLIDAAVALAVAHQEQEALFWPLQAEEIPHTGVLPPMGCCDPGRANETSSYLSQLLNDAVEHGFLTDSQAARLRAREVAHPATIRPTALAATPFLSPA